MKYVCYIHKSMYYESVNPLEHSSKSAALHSSILGCGLALGLRVNGNSKDKHLEGVCYIAAPVILTIW